MTVSGYEYALCELSNSVSGFGDKKHDGIWPWVWSGWLAVVSGRWHLGILFPRTTTQPQQQQVLGPHERHVNQLINS